MRFTQRLRHTVLALAGSTTLVVRDGRVVQVPPDRAAPQVWDVQRS
jgi:hypothetical protein